MLLPKPDAGQTQPASVNRSIAPRAWSMTVLLVVLYTLNTADKLVFGIIAQPLKENLGITSAQIGLVGSLFYLAFTIGGFCAGTVHRFIPLRWSIVLLALCWSATTLPVTIVATFGVLLVGRMLLGLSEGPSSALIHTAVYTWHPPERRGFPSSVIMSSVSLAKIALAPILAVIVHQWGWRAAIITLAAAGLVWCAIWFATWKEGPFATERSSRNAPENEVQSGPWVRWGTMFRTPTFIFASLLNVSTYALVTVVLTWLPSYFEEALGYSRLEAGSMLAIPSTIGLILMLTMGAISDRLVVRGWSVRVVRVTIPATGVLICGAILLSLKGVSSAAVAVAVLSIGYGLMTPAVSQLNAAISTMCPPKQTAGTMGFFIALMGVGGLVAPYLTGVILDAASTPVEGYLTAFQILGGFAALCAVLAIVLVNPTRDKAKLMTSAGTSW